MCSKSAKCSWNWRRLPWPDKIVFLLVNFLSRFQHKAKPSSIGKIFRFNRGNWHYAFIGLLGCTLSGLVVPFFALAYAQIFAVFSEPPEQLKRDALFWAAMFLVIGFLNALGFFISVLFSSSHLLQQGNCS